MKTAARSNSNHVLFSVSILFVDLVLEHLIHEYFIVSSIDQLSAVLMLW